MVLCFEWRNARRCAPEYLTVPATGAVIACFAPKCGIPHSHALVVGRKSGFQEMAGADFCIAMGHQRRGLRRFHQRYKPDRIRKFSAMPLTEIRAFPASPKASPLCSG